MNKAEAKVKHQDKQAMAADNWYLLHISPSQKEEPASVTMKSNTLAVEHAAANDRNERIWHSFRLVNINELKERI